MVLTWVNYLSIVVGVFNFVAMSIVTIIILSRNPKEVINWLFGTSFFFIAIAYVFLPLGSFTNFETNPTPLVLLTKCYALSLFLSLEFLMLSAISFNRSSHFIRNVYIIGPTILAAGIVAGLLFGLTDTSGPYYSVRFVPGERADSQMSLFFSAIFYPLTVIVIIIMCVFFIRAYYKTDDREVKRSLRFFFAGSGTCIASLIPNVLSNVLADTWEKAFYLNGIEFIMVGIGVTLLLLGFIYKPQKAKQKTPAEPLMS
ncbi:MAG: hypothetical protein U9O98_03015 [Asgard group archaeon]|nr:hypothetical protein [Asgard group archaeon]